ncbi:beta-glucosidase 12-like [Dioscorea cayenensis subsp. rotundata]|uniref:Beta-glucosidase 12-like n=1 Tax=Dioscorea cayennensis subsp. rotundata TaxID=55577 RepID=A0AB40AT26_DIOCR|nr:beta-glucosidase 12-like [Dioscorea cayenensis subsp. rotundata]
MKVHEMKMEGDQAYGTLSLTCIQEDVKIMKEMGLDAYRFSISWTRILPNGRSISGGINKEGVNYYNNLINELISNGLKPFVTLFHWDSPQALEDKYGGFLSENIIVGGYASAILAPGRCSPYEVGHGPVGDSSREPYVVAHDQLLAHAATVTIYKLNYQAHQNGKIGITINSNWYVPFSKSRSSDDSVQRSLDFMYGWFMDPLVLRGYPLNMRVYVGNRLPEFTKEQSQMVKGSFDFIGLNYYTSNYARNIPFSNMVNVSYNTDAHVAQTGDRNGILIGRQGLTSLANATVLSLEEALKDDVRVDFYKKHLIYLERAIKKGVDVRGYFAWSLLDNFE